MNGYHIRVWRTLVAWMLSTLLIFVVGTILTGVFGFFAVIFAPLSSAAFALILLLTMVIGAIWGWSIGVVQRWVLRRYFFWSAEMWVRASIIGGAVGAVLFSIINLAFAPTHNSLAVIIFLVCVSIAQWFVLRKTVQAAWLWILGMAISGLGLGDLTLRMIDHTLYTTWEGRSTNYYFDPSLLWIGFLMLLMIPAVVMLHLFIYQAYPMVPETERS
jgi:hypothetical protein